MNLMELVTMASCDFCSFCNSTHIDKVRRNIFIRESRQEHEIYQWEGIHNGIEGLWGYAKKDFLSFGCKKREF
jgi:hypothetical protein